MDISGEIVYNSLRKKDAYTKSGMVSRSANNTKTKVIADAALFTSKTMEEFKKNDMLFISRAPSKLKKAKEILKNHKEEEFIQLDENYQAIPM